MSAYRPKPVIPLEIQDGAINPSDALQSEESTKPQSFVLGSIVVLGENRTDSYLNTCPVLSSASAQWEDVGLEKYTVPAVLIPRHEHVLHFLHMVVRGAVRYEVVTGGRTARFTSRPGTTFLEPRGTVDEVVWNGSTQRIFVAIHPRLLVSAMEENAHESDIELTEHWDLVDDHISALLLEMCADLRDGSPAGRIYGESLANVLAVYLIKRYAIRRRIPAVYKGGLPGSRLKRVLDFIEAHLAENPGLSQIAAVAGMSPHYFSELFKQSTGHPPHEYILMQRIERAKQWLRDPECSIIKAGLNAGFRNASHFARMFRRIVGTTPSMFRSEQLDVRPDPHA
jgi:AraC family transcriptional regulator